MIAPITYGELRRYTFEVTSKLAVSQRDAQRRVERALSPLERLRLAQRLGDEAAAQFASAHGVTARESAREFARRRQLGRRRSRCASDA